MFSTLFSFGVSPERRVTAYYFLSAMSVGAANAFAGIWFSSKGMSPDQIGWINAAPVVVMLCLALFIGKIADRADDWRRVIVIGAVASALVPVALLGAGGFWGILILWTLAVTTQMSTLPVIDAAAMRMSRRLGFDFSALYAWKTVGYLAVIFASGYVLLWLGVAAFLPLFIGLSLVRGLAALTLPKFRAAEQAAPVEKQAGGLKSVMRPWFVLPLLGWTMVHSTHFVLNGFQGLLWIQQGISAEIVGLLIGVSGIAETVMFFAFKRFSKRFSARSLILVSCVVAVVRWAAMSLSPGVPLLFALQLLHAVTYALGFLACTNFIANWTHEDIAAEAQSFFTVLEFVVAIVALIAFGQLAGAFGARAYLGPAAFAAVGAALVGVSMWLRQHK